MAVRNEVVLRYNVNGRTVEVKAMDAVGPEDVYDIAIRAVLHRYKTGEDLWQPAPREVKDFIIKANLVI